MIPFVIASTSLKYPGINLNSQILLKETEDHLLKKNGEILLCSWIIINMFILLKSIYRFSKNQNPTVFLFFENWQVY